MSEFVTVRENTLVPCLVCGQNYEIRDTDPFPHMEESGLRVCCDCVQRKEDGSGTIPIEWVTRPINRDVAPIPEYKRPVNRADLRSYLREGTTCEVPTCEATELGWLLNDWLGFTKFSIRKSPRQGWSLMVPLEEDSDGD